MADFAVVQNGIVTNIVVADSIEIVGLVLPDVELVIEVTAATGVPFIGMGYRKTKNRFVPWKPAHSWSFNEKKFVWEPPVPYPSDGNIYDWDEASRSWVKLDLPNPEPTA